MRSLLRLGLFSFLIGLGGAAAAAAQTINVTGTVKDTSGAALSGATIDATVAGLSVATTTTGADGRYTIALASGTLHQLHARMDGFAEESAEVRSGSALSHDFTLRIAAVAQGNPLLGTDSADMDRQGHSEQAQQSGADQKHRHRRPSPPRFRGILGPYWVRAN